MLSDKRSQSRRRLDRRFSRHGNISELAPPWQGWIRTLRDALGMSGADLARRLGVHQSRISAIERGEREQTIKIETLARAAEALDCDLIYVLVPRSSLDEMVADQARRRAVEHLKNVVAHSRLENQEVTQDDLENQIALFTAVFQRRRDLWQTGHGQTR